MIERGLLAVSNPLPSGRRPVFYISYVVDWKRYKEEEKRRKQAKRAKLNASNN